MFKKIKEKSEGVKFHFILVYCDHCMLGTMSGMLSAVQFPVFVTDR